MYTKEIFRPEVGTIRKESIRALVEKCLENAPDYFWSMPASTTGKYHPEYTLGDGGLIRHTKAAVSIALDLLSLEQNDTLVKNFRDEIIAALILHDSVKKGRNGGVYTSFTHPLEASKFVQEMSEGMDINKNDVHTICRLIETHMGQWTRDYEGNELLEKPQTEAQKFVHMCDYLASRKNITVNVR